MSYRSKAFTFHTAKHCNLLLNRWGLVVILSASTSLSLKFIVQSWLHICTWTIVDHILRVVISFSISETISFFTNVSFACLLLSLLHMVFHHIQLHFL